MHGTLEKQAIKKSSLQVKHNFPRKKKEKENNFLFLFFFDENYVSLVLNFFSLSFLIVVILMNLPC